MLCLILYRVSHIFPNIYIYKCTRNQRKAVKVMQKTIQRLVDGVMTIKSEEIKAPKESAGRGEIVIGKIDDPEIQRLCAFYWQSAAAYTDMAAKSRASAVRPESGKHDPLKCPNCLAIANLATENEFVGTVRNMVWAAVRESLPIEAKIKVSKCSGALSICADWQIVLTEDDNAAVVDPIESILGPMFGMMGGGRGMHVIRIG